MRNKLVQDGYLFARRHPTEPLTIYNYTPKTQYEGLWNEHTIECRGLIVHDEGHVVARPYRKFWNAHEPHAEVPDNFVVLDKLDGSLGITYRTSDGAINFATRGSFESDQAKHATRIWKERYAHVEIPDGETWLFEIIYPANRIVVSYGDLDDLVLHGIVDAQTGEDLPIASAATWTGPKVEVFDPKPLAELLRDVRENAEGFVLREHPLPKGRPAKRVKVKFEEYLRLHKLLSGVTPRRIWECLVAGDDLEALIEGAPDEFYKQAKKTASDLLDQFWAIKGEAERNWQDIVAALGDADRKTYALRIQRQKKELQPLLFALLSGRTVDNLAWKRVEPKNVEPE